MTKTAQNHGFETWATDQQDNELIDFVSDYYTAIMVAPFAEGMAIWASPPCTAFSIASCGKHWHRRQDGTLEPKSYKALKSAEMIEHLVDMMQIAEKMYNCTYFIENPRGMLRKMPFMQKAGRRHTVTYCQYGDVRMKPTDIWTNSTTWQPLPMCKNGDSCHESAPRGSRTGTQGLKNNYERSKLPAELCESIVRSLGENVAG